MDDLQVDLNAGTAAAVAGSGTTTVALVDDHRMVRHALCSLLAHEDDIEVCAEAATAVAHCWWRASTGRA